MDCSHAVVVELARAGKAKPKGCGNKCRWATKAGDGYWCGLVVPGGSRKYVGLHPDGWILNGRDACAWYQK